jgi:CO/xanthine dehydrogenase Mo-binding subunit
LLGQIPTDVQLWADGSFVAVVAQQEHLAHTWSERVAGALTWQLPEQLPTQHNLPDFLRQAEHQTTLPFQQGQADWAAQAELPGQRFEASFFKPYLAHASIGPSCAVARWNGTHLEIWTHSQGIHNLRDDIVLALAKRLPDLSRKDITVHHVEGAGCYGHNGADDVAFDAVLMALKNPGVHVRVLWTREDELAHAPLGAAQSVQLQACVDPSGQITHWQHELWANGYSSRPGRARSSTLLAASQMAGGEPLPIAINPPLSAGGGADRNAVPGYALANLNVINHRLMVMPLRTSAMRGLGAFANVFAIESFMDEIASATNQDPLAFRLRHMQDERAKDVLQTVVQRSKWWSTPSPEGVGHGMAWARYKNTGAWCAVLARVEVGEQVRVLNLDLAVDVGMVVDLDGVINQTEGGALQSLSWTLKEQVNFDTQHVTSRDWTSYPILRFNEVPEVCVHVLDRPDKAPLGAGEAAQGPVAAALANAVSHALGLRLRQLPLTPDQLLVAIHAEANS